MSDFSHFDKSGAARMVDIGDKAVSERTATAEARVLMNSATLEMIVSGGARKGDVLGVARLAGIMGAKKTPELIPLCHPLSLSNVEIELETVTEPPSVVIRATCRVSGRTGVEMEAMTAASVAALTVYDMCKSVQRDMRIGEVRLLMKDGGKSGRFDAS